MAKNRVFCKDCQYKGPKYSVDGRFGQTFSRRSCLASPRRVDVDYVTGRDRNEGRFSVCQIVNKDGKCKLFKAKGGPPPIRPILSQIGRRGDG